MNASPDHSDRCTGSLDIVVPEGYDGGFGGRFPQESTAGLEIEYIRGRGNGTWGMSKLPYKFKLAEKANLFGMGSNKHWVLLANYFDNSLIRNWLTMWLGREIGLEFTPEGVFVDVVMNGEYLGNYFLCEQVRVGKSRVAIDELKPEDTDLPAVRGGYLLELFPDDFGAPGTFETDRGLIAGVVSPEIEDGSGNDPRFAYIRRFIRCAEDAIFSETGTDAEGRHYSELIDLRSAADYWWIQEFTVNGDGFRTDSAHLYKKRSEADGGEGKLYFGPLWDFDESWGNAQTVTTQDIGFNNCMSVWTDRLRTIPEFRALLEERWAVLDRALEEIVREGGVLDRTAAMIRNSWYRDRERWQADRMEDGTLTDRTLEEEIGHIRAWINLRREWISANRDRIGIINFTLTVRAEGFEDRQYEIPCDTGFDLADIESEELYDRGFSGWVTEDGTPVGDWLQMDRDITLTAVFGD